MAIAGRGDEEPRLRALASDLGISDRVRLLGLIDDVPQLLHGANVFVQCSRSEGLPLALLEAMSTALPVVVTAVGGMTQVVEDGISGLHVPPGDPDLLAAGLRAILTDAKRAALLGKQARQRIAEHYSRDSMMRAYRDVYLQRTAGNFRGRRPTRRRRA